MDLRSLDATQPRWSELLEVAAQPMPASDWRAALALGLRLATNADYALIATCPPENWDNRATAIDPPEHAASALLNGPLRPLFAPAAAERIYRQYGRVFVPIAALPAAPKTALKGLVCTLFLAEDKRLLGCALICTNEAPELVAERLRKALSTLSAIASQTLASSLDMANACGATVRELPPIMRSLSARELEVAELVADGLSNLNVGARLGISETTVSVHLRRIFKRLNIHNRVDLARMFMRTHGE